MKISKGTIARTVVLIIALINQVLTMTGHNPLPWSEEQFYEAATIVLTVGASMVSWWKNNSFTKAAIEADEIMHDIKKEAI